MNLCVFQGTFNPIHNGHLAIADFIRSNFKYDSILFIPAYKPPHKEIDDELATHRYEMVKLAITGQNKYNISNIEYQNNKFSYTYNTIVEIYKRYKVSGKIGFIIGSDAFNDVAYWHETEQLKKLVEFIIFPREDNFKAGRLEKFKEQGYLYRIAPMNYIELSSTMLRTRVRKGKTIAPFVPEKVLEYIQNNELYLAKVENEENDATDTELA